MLEEDSEVKESQENDHKRSRCCDDNDEKLTKRQKRDKKKGQNKSRPKPFRETRDVKLCKTLVEGDQENAKNCPYENCMFIHDIEQYLSAKLEDIGTSCYIYSTRGYCQYGLTCRFAQSHLDAQKHNKMLDTYDKSALPKTFNQISYDLQMILRKKKYNFDKAKILVEELEQNRGGNNKKQDESLTVSVVAEVDVTNTNIATKPIGYSSDADLIKDKHEQKKKIDFREKLLLSPLTTVGNLPFRRICKEYGADVTCGEMSCSLPIINGAAQEWALTKKHESEDIFGVQICGHKANLVAYAVQLLNENTEIDFIDLNLGCPIDLIYQQGGGSALLRRVNVLEVIVKSCSRLLENKPFTIKTRTGIYANKSVAHELVPKFEEWGASMVTIHGRSREQRYSKTADWEYIQKCAEQAKHIPVMGNGDILNYEDYNEARKIAKNISGCMIGRGALIKPWIFQEIKEQKTLDPSSTERYELLQKYVNYGLEHWGSDNKGVENTRKFLLEWQSFLHRYTPSGILKDPPQKINVRAEHLEYRDEMEALMGSNNCADWIKLSERLLGKVPEGFQFLPKHKANSY